MSSDYTLTPDHYARLKTRLHRLINDHDWEGVIAEREHAFTAFQKHGWPDDWAAWERAADDARLQIQMASKDWLWQTGT